MRKLRKCIACLLTATLAFGSTGFLPAGIRPVFSITANAEEAETGNFSELQALITQNYGGTLTLDKDYIAQSDESFLEIGGTITIDLNGHTINRALESVQGNGCVIKNSGNLTVTDTSEAQNGVITGGCDGVYNVGTFTLSGGTISGNTAEYGGGVFNVGTFTLSGGTISGNTGANGGGVYNGGKFTMTDGTISGNSARQYGGGVFVSDNGKFTMSGGKISNNSAYSHGGGVSSFEGTFTMSGGIISDNTTQRGGGVYIFTGTFTMTDGIISGNVATEYGGGVVYGCNGYFRMSGGTISDNTAKKYGGGVYIDSAYQYYNYSRVSIETGTPIFITDNTASGKPSNLYLKNNKITIAGIPADGSVIGVSSNMLPTSESPVEITCNYNGSDCSFLVSDNENFNVMYDKCAWLVYPTTASFTAQPQDASGCIGDKVQFSVSVEGEVQSYQWQYYNKSTRTWEITKLTGNKTATLTVPVTAGRNTMQYRCVITDSKNYKILSSAAALSVIPKIITQPQSVSAQLGTKVKLSVEATGANLIYQWQYYNKAEHKWLNTKLSGNQTNTLTVPATAGRDGMMYWCIVKDAKNGIKVYSGAATVRVK